MHALLRTAALAAALSAAAPALAADVAIEPATAGSVSIDATVYHVATPDTVNMNVSCEATEPGSRLEVRDRFRTMLQRMVTAVGTDGTVRRNGSPGMYPYYGSNPYDAPTPPLYSGNMQVTVLDVRPGSGVRLSDAMEEMGCTVSWDARLLRTTAYARQMHAELMEQLSEKKAYFEELLGTRLSKVANVYVSTSQDGGGYYGGPASYDPESNTLPAMTSLSITYDIGTGQN